MKSLLNKILPSLLTAFVLAALGWVWRVEASRNAGAQADDYIWKAITDHEARLRGLERPTRGMEDEAEVEPEALRAEYEAGR